MRRIDSDERQRSTTATPSRPTGSDGAAPLALLSLVIDTTVSPSSRRLAFDTAALRMRPTRLPPRAARPRSRAQLPCGGAAAVKIIAPHSWIGYVVRAEKAIGEALDRAASSENGAPNFGSPGRRVME